MRFEVASTLPTSPGVYRYLNKTGKVIYVGKAKNLHRRVNSYFNRVHPVRRTNMLVHHIWDLVTVVVNTEEEALDLENSLIKQYQPHYNVLLKDDKSYPWICVTKEPYPRVFITRDTQPKGEILRPLSQDRGGTCTDRHHKQTLSRSALAA